MPELLFEIFCEEIPARMQVRAGADLQKALVTGLEKSGIMADKVQVFTGPRRLTFVADVPIKSPDISEERKGPRVGSPEQALAGFLRGAGLSDISEAEIRTDPKKGEYYVAVIEKPGEQTEDILKALIPATMNNFPWPKSMKSGGAAFRWVRPLQSMICLLDGKAIDFTVGDVATGNTTEGHRRHGKGPFTVTGFADYKSQLEGKGHVVLAAKDRKDLILTGARKVCADAGLELVEDEGLLNEVAGLAEWPVVILGDMDPSFLELPGEVIRLSMRTHQKYFAVRNPKTGDLAPNFVVVANQAAPDGGKAIAAGNSRVLSARLADAQFFQSEDAKLKLEDYYDKLDTVVFHNKLGSIRDKAARVEALARELAPKVGADPDAAAMAARLAKCDLVTNMVIEFTSLQGQIGAMMYRREIDREIELTSAAPSDPRAFQESARPTSPADAVEEKNSPTQSSTAEAGEVGRSVLEKRGGSEGAAISLSKRDHSSIATAIEDHYKPQGPSDSVPTDPVAVAVALADKLDTLVGFWAIDEKPTGSKDPFALRRAALGVVRIILENDVRINLSHYSILSTWILLTQPTEVDGLKELVCSIGGIGDVWKSIAHAQKGDGERITRSCYNSCPEGEFNRDLLAFILDRLKGDLRDKGYRHDHIDAVLALGGDDLVDIVNRVKALSAFLETSEGTDLLAGYKRAANILKSEAKRGDLPTGAPQAPKDTEGAALFGALQTARPKITAALEAENYSDALSILSTLRTPIDAFFTHTQVIADDSAVKENNLRLLSQICDTASQIADFDALEGA